MRWIRRHILPAYAFLAFCYLMLPIAVVILFSFNAPTGRYNYVWEGFTFDNWINWDSVPGIKDAVITSLEIGVISTIAATILGTMLALAIVRHQFRGPRRHQHADLPADVDARDRARRLAADALPQHADLHGVRDDLHRPRDVHRQLRRRHREGAADRLRSPPRGGGNGSRRRSRSRPSARSRCRCSPPPSSALRCSASPSRSTTS